MNDKAKYAEMLEIPVATSNITYKPSKKKKTKVKKEGVKETLIDKINAKILKSEKPVPVEDEKAEKITAIKPNNENCNIEKDKENAYNTNLTSSVVKKKSKKFSFKITAVGVELCIICVLVLTILLTSAFIPNSGINSFFTGAFNKQDDTAYNLTEFSPVFSYIDSKDVSEENGVMTIKNQSNLYSPENGIVESVSVDDNGLYSIVIKHGGNIRTVISGANYCYVEEGNKVYGTIPVGYVKGGDVCVCFIDGENNVITESVQETFSLWG